MKADAVARCITHGLPKLDPDKEAFSYLTAVVTNCFLARINKENRLLKVKMKLITEALGNEFHDRYDDEEENEDDDENYYDQEPDDDYDEEEPNE